MNDDKKKGGKIKRKIEKRPKESAELRKKKDQSIKEPEINQNPPTQPEGPEEQQEGRKLCVTKYRKKYHFEKTRDGLKGYQNFERKACTLCQQRTKEILTLSASSGSRLGFQSSSEEHHAEECLVYRNDRRSKTKRMICKICEREEITLIWVRNRESPRRG